MIQHTFCHVPRLGVATEQRLWAQGLTHWDDALSEAGAAVLGKRANWVRAHLEESRERLAGGDVRWFQDHLPSHQHWRLFDRYRDDCAYLDIETTGLGDAGDHITTIAVSRGGELKTYVFGENLEDVQDDLADCPLLVTYNG